MTRSDVRCTTLLLLEDDPAIASLVSYALTRDGFEVDHVNLVHHAQLRLDDPARSYAAAILDVGLPDGNGLDLCRALRLQGHRWAALPILMLTARSEELDRVLGLELGADDYVSKPFSPRELVARVRALLRRASLPPTPPAMPQASTPHGPLLVCDATAQRATFGGQPLPLTRREWGLLATLLQSPGRIWSREALLDAVWGHTADSTDRTVDTHIKTLRAKLREAGCPDELIGTHRGMGYAIDPAKLAG